MSVTQNSTTIAWDEIVLVTQYVVDAVDVGEESVIFDRSVVTEPTVTQTGLEPGVVYSYTITPIAGSVTGSIPYENYAQITGILL